MRNTLPTVLRNLALAAAALTVTAGPLWAELKGTPHDFRNQSWSRNEPCRPCHTTRTGSRKGFEWNRAVTPDSAFTTRDGATLGRMSLMCLGCHDGQTAMDSFGGATGTSVMTGSAVVGTDLSDDHPVGVAYPAFRSKYRDAASVGRELLLTDGRIECQTCHDPHDNRNGKFLRVTSQTLCQTCHLL